MTTEKLFKNINEEIESEEGPQVTEIESVCLNCREDGITKIFLTKIPFFKEVAVMSFNCEHCNWSNNELQPVGSIQEKGIVYSVKCTNERDLNRQIVKSEWAEIKIPEIEFEVKKQNGLITTIEGIIDRAVNGLRENLTQAIENNDETLRNKLSQFIMNLTKLKENFNFTFILDDPTGNSYIENPFAPNHDELMEIRNYERTNEQNKLIGCVSDESLEANKGEFNVTGEVLEFPTNCTNCNAPCLAKMKVTLIPYFKEVIIMALNCDSCGYKSNEIKSGAGIEEKGCKITKKIKDLKDLNCDVVRSDTCLIIIPELELEMRNSGSGQYTTIEGLIEYVKEQLRTGNPLISGDSAKKEIKEKMDNLIDKLSPESLIGLNIILDDPCGNSFIHKADNVDRYKRTFDQDEELGINDMKTENYQENKQ